MSEGFKIVICILFLMMVIGEFHLFAEENIFPGWMYVIISFYGVLLCIDERIVPLIKDINDLFENGE